MEFMAVFYVIPFLIVISGQLGQIRKQQDQIIEALRVIDPQVAARFVDTTRGDVAWSRWTGSPKALFWFVATLEGALIGGLLVGSAWFWFQE